MSYILDLVGGMKRYSHGNLFVQTATKSCSNTTSETTLTHTGAGALTLPANFFIAGRSLAIRAGGYFSSIVTPTLTIKIKYGSTVIATMTGTSVASTSKTWLLDAVITCRTTGSSGTVFTIANYRELVAAGLNVGNNATGTVTINTTTSNAISVTAQWGTASASNNINMSNLILEAIA